MKRPWEILAAGTVSGVILARGLAGFSVAAAACVLAASFACVKMSRPDADEGEGGRGAADRGAAGCGAAGRGASGRGALGSGVSGRGASGRGAAGRGVRVGKDLPAARRRSASAAVLLFSAALLAGALRYTLACRPTEEMRRLEALTAAEGRAKTELSLRAESMELRGENLVIRSGAVLVYVPAGETCLGDAGRVPAGELRGGDADSVPAGGLRGGDADRVPAGGLRGGDADRVLPVRCGNRYIACGTLIPMEPATNPGQFDFAAYYRAKGITHRMYADSAVVTDPAADPAADLMFRFRTYCGALLTEALSPKSAGFLRAVLFGDRQGLDEDMYDQYRRNGIAHILAISGLHAAVLGLSLYGLLRKRGLGFLASGLISSAFLILYSLLTGSGTGVVRASVMLLLSFLASCLGRTYDLRSAACFAAVVLLLASPHELFQCGFQLSFLAVLAIGGPAETLLKALFPDRKKARGSVGEAVTVSLTVMLVTLPVIAYWFFSVPVYSFLLNLLVIPLMSCILWSGLAALALLMAAAEGPASGMLRFAARTSGGIVERLLELYSFLCDSAERLPCLSILTGRPRPPQILLYCLVLAAGYGLTLWLLRREASQDAGHGPGEHGPAEGGAAPGSGMGGRRTADILRKIAAAVQDPAPHRPGSGSPRARRARALLPAAAGIVLAVLCLRPVRPKTPEIWFLDIGQGDAIVILYRDTCVTIDGGSTSNTAAGQYILQPFLESRAVRTIDTAFVTHADADHMNGVEYLLNEDRGLSVRSLVLPEPAAGAEKYDSLREAAASRGTAVRYMAAGGRDGAFRCLSPAADLDTGDVNDHSLVLLFTFGDFRAVFTGDAGTAREAEIISLAERDPALAAELHGTELLKAGHHGSETSTSEAFLRLLSPGTAVISCGRHNRYGHPHAETLERLRAAGCVIRRTDQEGAVLVRAGP